MLRTKVYRFTLLSLLTLATALPLLAGDTSPFDLVQPSHPSYYDLEELYERGYLEGVEIRPLVRQEPVSRYMMAFYTERAKARMEKASEHPGIVVPFVRVSRGDEEKIERLVREYWVELKLIAKKYAGLRRSRDEMVDLVDRLEKNVDEMEEDFVEANLTDQTVMLKGRVSFGTSVSEGYNRPIVFGVVGDKRVGSRGFGMSRNFNLSVISQSTVRCRFNLGQALNFRPGGGAFSQTGVYGAPWFGRPNSVTYRIQFEEEDFDIDFSAGKVLFIKISPLVFQPYLYVTDDWAMGRTERFGEWADNQIQGVRLEFERLPKQMKGLFGIGRIGFASDRNLIQSGGRLEIPLRKHLFALNYGYTGEDVRNKYGTRFMNLTTSVSDIARVDTYFKLSTEIAMSTVDTGYHFDFIRWEQDYLSRAWAFGQSYARPFQNPKMVGFAFTLRADRRIEIGDWQMPFAAEYFEVGPDFISPPTYEHGMVHTSTHDVAPPTTGGTGSPEFSIPINLEAIPYNDPNRIPKPSLITNIGEADTYTNNQRGAQVQAKIKGLGDGTLDLLYKLSQEMDPWPESSILANYRILRSNFQGVGTSAADSASFTRSAAAVFMEFYDPDPKYGTQPNQGGTRAERLWVNHIRLSYVYSVNKLPIFREFIRTKRTFFRVVWYNSSIDTTMTPDFDEMCAMHRIYLRCEGFIQISASINTGVGYSTERIESFYVKRMWIGGFDEDRGLYKGGGHMPKYAEQRTYKVFFGWDMPGGVRLTSNYSRTEREHGTGMTVGSVGGSHALSVGGGIGF